MTKSWVRDKVGTDQLLIKIGGCNECCTGTYIISSDQVGDTNQLAIDSWNSY